MSPPTFSVIVPCHNYADFVGLTLDSIVRQQRNDVEVVVVDDASTDDTPNIVPRHRRDVRYIRLEKNVGPGQAWALGIEAARGKYVAKIDADDWLLPGWFDAVEEAFNRNSKIGLVAGNTVIYRNSDDISFWRVTGRNRILEAEELRARLLRRFFFRMPSLCLRTEMLRGHTLPRADLWLGHDWEFFIRSTKSWKGYLLHRTLGVYRVHASSVTLTSTKNNLHDDFLHLLAMIEDPYDPAFLEPNERRIFTAALAKTYLGIVGPQFSLRDPRMIREQIELALDIARHGGPTSVARTSIRLVSGALQRASRALGWRRTTGLRMKQLLPPGYDVPATKGSDSG